MKKKKLIDKILQGAKQDEQLRLDPRYLETMGFLTAKGFLKTNQNIIARPNKRIAIHDAIWAGMARNIPTLNGFSGNAPKGWFFGNINQETDLRRLQDSVTSWTQRAKIPFDAKCWINEREP